jgi:hypothetical protein
VAYFGLYIALNAVLSGISAIRTYYILQCIRRVVADNRTSGEGFGDCRLEHYGTITTVSSSGLSPVLW